MKRMNTIKTALIIIMLALANSMFAQKTFNPMVTGEKANFHDIQQLKEKEWEGKPVDERRGWKQYKRWEYFWEQRTFPTGEFPDGIRVYNDVKEWINHEEPNRKGMHDNPELLNSQWQALGPFDQPEARDNREGIGRINAVRFHPNNPEEIWAGSASGGLWKSVDGGKSWETFAFTQFLSLGVSDIAFSESNPDVVYVTTGDVFGSAGSSDYYSVGVIKTTDGGQSWNVTGLAMELKESKLLGRILVHPADPNTAIVATSEGIYKTVDGGNNWANKEDGAFFIDMESKPGDFKTIYASTFSWSGNGKIFKSTDMGETWEATFSENNIVRIALAVTPDNPNKIFAIAAQRGNFYSLNSILMSFDSGNNWTKLGSYENPESIPNVLGRQLGAWDNEYDLQSQGQYDLCIAVSPTNENEIYTGGINMWRTTDGGNNFFLWTHWYGGYSRPYIHADHHDLVFSPDGTKIYTGNDGGIDVYDFNSASWESLSDGLEITQFYRISVYDEPGGPLIMAGAQDNGTKRLRLGKWEKVKGGDGMNTAINHENPQYVYGATYDGNISWSSNYGNSWKTAIAEYITNESGAWVAPYTLNPQNPKTIIVGHQNVWRHTYYGDRNTHGWERISNFGTNATLNSLEYAPSDSNYIYAANNSSLYKTTDGGQNWTNLIGGDNSSLAGISAISNIAVDPNNPDRIWITKSGFNEFDKVFEFNGAEVKNLSGNLPNVPVNTILYQLNSPDRIYAGTDIGVFYSDYGSANWQKLGTGLPNLIILDLEASYNTNEIYAGSYGRGVWKVSMIECNGTPLQIEALGETTFCPGESVTLRAVSAAGGITWSNGEAGPEITVSEPGAYSIEKDEGNGCITRSPAIIVEHYPSNDLTIIPDNEGHICEGSTINLRASFGFQEYEWSNGETGNAIEVSEPGKYSVKVVTEFGCEINYEVEVVSTSNPETPVITQQNGILYAPDGYKRYQWYKDGKRMLGQNKYFTEVGETGEYEVVVFNEYNCESRSEVYSVLSSVESNVAVNRVTISPNPGDGLFRVNIYEIGKDAAYSVRDIAGRNVIEGTFNNAGYSASGEIDLSGNPSGVYILRISSGEFTHTEKLIVK
jgi:photosystem II stability/assembly factor-like uncharacterized protein